MHVGFRALFWLNVLATDEFLDWFQQALRPGFTKATVSAWRVSLEARGLGSFVDHHPHVGDSQASRYRAARI